MHKIKSACTFTRDAVDKTSSTLMMLFTVYLIESNTFCGTPLRAAATRHMEYNKIGGGDGFATNSA